MEDSILKFKEQFDYEPKINNEENIKDFDHVIFCGMGGSHLAADLIKTIKPGIDLYVHKDYDLPPYEEDFLRRGLLVACSYSGNTEETLSFFRLANQRGLNISVITTGGKLLHEAIDKNSPYVEIPNTGIQPRQADGYLALALSKLIGDEEMLANLNNLSQKIKNDLLKGEAEKISKELKNKIPIIYASNQNLHLAYNWKITLNETGKTPAFYNVFPELNHNEMQGFDLDEEYRNTFHVIFIRDNKDDSRIAKRMILTKKLYEERGITTSEVLLDYQTREEKVFNAVVLADWLALNYANKNNKEPEKVPMIEEFKDKLK